MRRAIVDLGLLAILLFLFCMGCTDSDPNGVRMFLAKNIYRGWTDHSNPCVGPMAELTFGGQSTYIQKIEGNKDVFTFMADILGYLLV